jgi:bifunctional DNA-binding transcriptional regulator/antitoxin component of YhaV-PrlF toxin-antitoxin module
MHYNGREEEAVIMATLTVTARGQVTLKKELLQHLGIEPGGKVEVDLLPGGRVALQAARRKGSIMDLSGILAGKTTKVATIEEINGAIAAGWSGEV